MTNCVIKPSFRQLMYMSSSILIMFITAILMSMLGGVTFSLLTGNHGALIGASTGAFIGYMLSLCLISILFLRTEIGSLETNWFVRNLYSIKIVLVIVIYIAIIVTPRTELNPGLSIAGRLMVLLPTLWLSTPYLVSHFLTGNYQLNRKILSYIVLDLVIVTLGLAPLRVKFNNAFNYSIDYLALIEVVVVTSLYMLLLFLLYPFVIKRYKKQIQIIKKFDEPKILPVLTSITYIIFTFLGFFAMILWLLFA